ncbi:hypothetical protein SKAU_G00390800 [Synaphobranchus kaupii]|uniref:Uncharacterized protein n=1 Tax=Synaphobranchus kaupii TaxID=118154 RepID=A0A9Q1EBE0_SYNKA|nr:hypothetical protein SKAU_G00390800 [Synaphobranchus kaupii]
MTCTQDTAENGAGYRELCSPCHAVKAPGTLHFLSDDSQWQPGQLGDEQNERRSFTLSSPPDDTGAPGSKKQGGAAAAILEAA